MNKNNINIKNYIMLCVILLYLLYTVIPNLYYIYFNIKNKGEFKISCHKNILFNNNDNCVPISDKHDLLYG